MKIRRPTWTAIPNTRKAQWPLSRNDEPFHPLHVLWAGVLDKLLCKNRAEPYASAEAVLEALANPACTPAPRKRAPMRLIVLPFSILRPHDSTDFLSLGLPDAITSSLAAIDSLLVRSTMVASRLASAEFDVKMISEQAQVDAIQVFPARSWSMYRFHCEVFEEAIEFAGRSQLSKPVRQ